MSKEKIIQLTKYATDIKNRLASDKIPEKHKNRLPQYKQFLQRELDAVNSKIDTLKMSMPVESGKK